MPYGYSGKTLRVNLNAGTISVDEHDENFYRTYFGGRGVIAYYLLKEAPVGADPLGPENMLIFAPGVITGSPAAGCGRNSIGAKSPLTGLFGEVEVGGFFGAELKHAGYDGVVVEGKSTKPVYLWLQDGQTEIRDASHLWGMTTAESHEAICDELGDGRVRTAQIGPGGEKMVRYACIMGDVRHAGGRAGLGAVMGSKNLKAVAVRGRGGLDLADPEKVRSLAHWMAQNWKGSRLMFNEHGTAGQVMGLNASGALPTRNFHEGVFEGAEKISGEAMSETILTNRESCYACPIRCKRVVEAKEPYDVNPAYGGPEYETIAALGSLCCVDDLVAIAKANELCNAYSVDTISAGGAIAFAMECFENGLLTEEDTGGIDLRFGNADAMVKVMEMICKREGIGDLLAEGVYPVAKKLGPQAMSYAMHIKGQGLPLHEPRFKQAMGIAYALSPTGADHLQTFHDSQYAKRGAGLDYLKPIGLLEPMPTTELSSRKIRYMVYGQHWRSFFNMAVYCLIVPYSFGQMVDLVNGVTGWDTSVFELLKAGERGTTLARVFNVREGLRSDQDTLPERMFEPFTSGPLKGVAVDRSQAANAIQEYYSIMGWDGEGVPTVAKLDELNVSWAAEYLKQAAVEESGS